MKTLVVIVLISLGLSSFARSSTKPKLYSELDSIEKARLDSTFYSKIPYNANKAVKDIKNDTIRIIRLTPGGFLTYNYDELMILEKRFDFIFHYDFLRLPDYYLSQKEKEYNDIVFRYLDSIYGIDTEKEIRLELIRMYLERTMVANRTDKELKKIINKSLRGERKEIKNKILNIDKKYRDRKFEEALKEYHEISLLNIKKCTQDYIINSKYHCYMNMLQFDQAEKLNKDYEIIKTLKK